MSAPGDGPAMKSERRLVIDIGTNSVLALLADISGGDMRVVFDRQKTTRLGEDLSKTGRLSDAAMAGTVQAIGSFVENSEFDSALLIGTEALRVASNSDEFIDRVEKKTGHRPVVISGDQEAEFTFRGALFDLEPISGDIIAADVGGGSTEIIRGETGRIIEMASIPLGAMNLRESVPEDMLAAYREYAGDFIGKRGIFGSDTKAVTMIGIGGTITSVTAIAAGLGKFDPKIVHGCRINSKTLASIASRFEGLDSQERRELILFDPQRADLILPGTGIFLAVMGIIGVSDLTVSAGGLRYGVALPRDYTRQ